MNSKKYLQETPLLDYNTSGITQLIQKRGWDQLEEYDKIGAVYDFVKDELAFGYNESDALSASHILKDGYGQCNTKGTVLMALLRYLGIPCRLHGFTIDNALQKGAIPAFLIPFAPRYILHSWVEIWFRDEWVQLEGFILDTQYLSAIQQKFKTIRGAFCGYGVATPCLSEPNVEWKGTHTYIQKEGIHDDFGVFSDPDSFYRAKGTNLSGIKDGLYRFLIRHIINRNVQSLRQTSKLSRE